MQLYLSSFRVGERTDELCRMAAGRQIGLIPNALDGASSMALGMRDAAVDDLESLGIDVSMLDLRDYFGDAPGLKRHLAGFDGVWVHGGNTFVLRQAMRLSGFDQALADVADDDFLYGGFSAGVCILAPRLEGLQLVDDPDARPYGAGDVVWDGLGILPYLVLPHYQSEHPESNMIDSEVEYCTRLGISFRTLRDGEVIVGRYSRSNGFVEGAC